MCTVSFIPRSQGYDIGMNRDEQRRRPKAHAPRIRGRSGHHSLYPSEPRTGGTWIAVNQSGLTFCLINWYSQEYLPPGVPQSRGEIIPQLLPATTLSGVLKILKTLPLVSYPPFRLIIISAQDKKLCECLWAGLKLHKKLPRWHRSHWFSSGWDEPGATKTRAEAVRTSLLDTPLPSLSWLRRLHRSHRPDKNAYSICMHREDAVTVSTTEINVRPRVITMRYQDGPPCERKPIKLLCLHPE